MKSILLILLFLFIYPFFLKAQCAIYICPETGAFGAGYNIDGEPTSMQECIDLALKMCEERGGPDCECQLLAKSNDSGWYAFISGRKEDGYLFRGQKAANTKEEAEEAARASYKSLGGLNADNIKIYSWYVYSNPK